MSSCRSQIPSGTARAARSRSYAYGKNKFFELLAAGRRQEAETVQRALPPIREREARQSLVDGVNHQTITRTPTALCSLHSILPTPRQSYRENLTHGYLVLPPPPSHQHPPSP